jgi:hypothetical protein
MEVGIRWTANRFRVNRFVPRLCSSIGWPLVRRFGTGLLSVILELARRGTAWCRYVA